MGQWDRPTKIQKSTRPVSVQPEAWTRFSKKQKNNNKLRTGQKKGATAISTPQQGNLRGYGR